MLYQEISQEFSVGRYVCDMCGIVCASVQLIITVAMKWQMEFFCGQLGLLKGGNSFPLPSQR
jgi:hypothetical protein